MSLTSEAAVSRVGYGAAQRVVGEAGIEPATSCV